MTLYGQAADFAAGGLIVANAVIDRAVIVPDIFTRDAFSANPAGQSLSQAYSWP